MTKCLRSILAVGLAFTFYLSHVEASRQAPAAETKKPEADAKKPDPPPVEKPFAELIKDAKPLNGLFNVYRTDEKVYLELRPEQFDKTYMVSLTCESGLGERGFYAAQMCGEMPIQFHKEAKNVQLIAKNVRFRASDSTAFHRAMGRSFSDSVLGATKVESLPHPERKSVLIDLGALLLTDFPMQAFMLESTFRIPYRFDAKNSYFGAIKAFDTNVEIGTVAHYAAERPPLPPLLAPGAHAAADARAAAQRARCAQPDLRVPVQLLRSPGVNRLPPASGGRSRRTLLCRCRRLHDRRHAYADAALHHALASRETESIGGAVAADEAHRLLDGEYDSCEVPRRRASGRAAVEQGIREDRLPGCHRHQPAAGQRRMGSG